MNQQASKHFQKHDKILFAVILPGFKLITTEFVRKTLTKKQQDSIL